MQREIKKYYDMLVNNGDLEMLLPDLTGTWEEDKKDFTIYYKDIMDIVVHLEDIKGENNN